MNNTNGERNHGLELETSLENVKAAKSLVIELTNYLEVTKSA